MGLFNFLKKNDIYSENDDYETAKFDEDATDDESSLNQIPFDKSAQGMLQMIVVRPTEFSEATTIANSLKNGQAVVLNLEDIEDEKARRLIDYIAGVLYAIDGKIERPSERTFLLTPNGVNVATDKI